MRIVSLWSVVLLGTASVVGCVADDTPAPARDAATASIRFPLLRTTATATYRLTGHIQVTEPDGTVQNVDATGDDASLLLSVAPGVNRVELLPGWALTRSYDGTTFEPVSALLGSTNPVNLVTPANQVTPWTLEFLVREASGDVRLSFEIVEQPSQLTAILIADEAFGDYAAYAGDTLDLELYMQASTETVVDNDGLYARDFRASAFAAELFSDRHGGQLATLVSRLSGGSLGFHVRHYSEGFGAFTGSVIGYSQTPATRLTLGETDASFTPEGEYPSSTSFVAYNGPFQLWSGSDLILAGRVSVATYQGQ